MLTSWTVVITAPGTHISTQHTVHLTYTPCLFVSSASVQLGERKNNLLTPEVPRQL